jgi:hypothetical protein
MSEATETTAVQEIKQEKRTTDFSLGIFGSSDNFAMAGQMAKTLAMSTIVPKDYQNNGANAMVAIEIATRLKTSPLMVMQNLNVIQGRPSWSAQFLIAMVNGSGKYDMELQFEEKEKDGKPFSCQCWTTRGGRKVTGPVIDMTMAKAEGWIDKNGSKWKTMPQIMLRYRAASFFARMNCPELTLGYYSKEEVIDGDFKEYPMEEMQMQVEQEIVQNQGAVDLPTDAEIDAAMEQNGDLPSFMTAE